MWTLGHTEKEEKMRFPIKLMRICECHSLSVVRFESSFRLLNIYSRKYLHQKKTKKNRPSNLL